MNNINNTHRSAQTDRTTRTPAQRTSSGRNASCSRIGHSSEGNTYGGGAYADDTYVRRPSGSRSAAHDQARRSRSGGRRYPTSGGGATAHRNPLSPPVPQLIAALLCALLAFSIVFVLNQKPELIGKELGSDITELVNPALGEYFEGKAIKTGKIKEITENISSRNALLIDLHTGRAICEKNSDTITYPASLTKIMSAIVAIENIPDPNTTMLTVPQELVDQLVRENSSMAGFSAGETVSATDLLYGCLLSSGGEATGTLALYVGGGEESEFVAMMNKKAEELGCASTHFANPTGLHSISHTSTAIDMAKIFRYALQNETFRTIVTSSSYYTSHTEQHPNGITLTSTVYKAFSQAGLEMGSIRGGKTGFTLEARQCLATYYSGENGDYILITMGAGDGTNTTYDNARDASIIYRAYVDKKQ